MRKAMTVIEKDIKHYRVLEKLGEGDIGAVYKVLDTKLDEIRALRLIRPALARDASFMARFVPAAKELTRLNHPNIVTLHWCFEKPPEAFLVMEYVQGRSLADLLRHEGPLPYTRALPLFKQVLRGLAYAHGKGITHHDLKPSDVLVDDDEQQVKLAGFGLTRKADGTVLAEVPVPAEALHYLSPEHVKSRARLDHRSDLYAVGVALYQALTGRTPFEAPASYLVMRAIIEEEIVPPARRTPGIPEALSEVVMRALARDPADRFQHAEDMLAALEAFEARAPEVPAVQPPAAPPPPGPRATSPRKRLIYGVVVLALMGTAALAWWALRDILAPAPPPPDAPAAQVDSVTVRTGVYERILSSVGSAADGTGGLLLQALPFGEIRVANRAVGADSLEVVVGAGRRRITFVHPLYGERQVEVEVRPGQRKEVICYFEGYLRVQASDAQGLPLQAELFVDGQATGRRTPVEHPFSLGPGTYTVEVFLEGYLGAVSSVVVRPVDGDGKVDAPPVEPLAFVLRKIE